MQYALRPAQEADRDWLDALRREAYQDLFRATWGGWDEARHLRQFSKSWERGHISIVGMGDVPVGMIQTFEATDTVEVGEIQILPHFQNQGIGRALLRNVIEDAHRQKRSVVLSLGLKNEGAHRLYEQLGFRESSRSDTRIHMCCPAKGGALP